MHQGSKSKSGWYYEKRRRILQGIVIKKRGRPKALQVVENIPDKVYKKHGEVATKLAYPSAGRGRPTKKQELINLARVNNWELDENSFNY